MDELRVLSSLPKLKNFYLQNKKTDKENSQQKSTTGTNPVCDHPAYTTTLLRYVPDLQVLDGERIQLRESTQKAMLDAMATPAEKLEIPERQRWLDGFSWDTSEVEGKASTAAARRRKPRPGKQQKLTKDAGKPIPWTSMFSEEFVDAATNEETIKFENTIAESKALDVEAEALLKSCE
jgi:hypothetical protein